MNPYPDQLAAALEIAATTTSPRETMSRASAWREEMKMTLEQQLDAIMHDASIATLQLSAVREDDGSVRFYTALHAAEGGCVFSEYMNKATANEAIASGIDALNRKRTPDAVVAPLSGMAA